MFGNFLYYIIALLIYSTYQPADDPNFPVFRTLVLFFVLIAFFSLSAWLQFRRVRSRIGRLSVRHLDHRFHFVLTRLYFLALAVFAVDVYVLNLGVLFYRVPVVKQVPTLEALLFLALFIGYLILVWTFAYGAYTRIYKTGDSRREYLLSNIFFSLPVLLPWLILSATVDLIDLLPFEGPKRMLSSPAGQIGYFLLFLFLLAVIGPWLIQWFWRCRPLKPGMTRYRIEALCRRAGMKYREIMVWPLFGGRAITAGVMGLVRRFRYILITPALIRQLNPLEIDAVIAHEIGHIQKKHLLFYLVFFAGYLVIAFSLLYLTGYMIIYAEAVYGIAGKGADYNALASITFSFVMIVAFLVYFRYIFGYYMRNFERQADLHALSIMGSAQPLITTFEKIAASTGQPKDRPNWHHFSLQERIDYLDKSQRDQRWVVRHHRKIKKSIMVYTAAMILAGWAGYQLNFGAAAKTLNTGLLKTIITHRIEKQPDNADLYQVLGDIYYSENDFNKTIAAYQKAIELDPNQVPALNNLAWLYATCPDPDFRRPGKALQLAKRAAELSRQAHILDTLAEAYYVNGDIRKAVSAGKAALRRADSNQSYYRDQIDKFRSGR